MRDDVRERIFGPSPENTLPEISSNLSYGRIGKHVSLFERLFSGCGVLRGVSDRSANQGIGTASRICLASLCPLRT